MNGVAPRDPRVDPTDPPPPVPSVEELARRVGTLGDRVQRLEVSARVVPPLRSRAVALPPASASIADMPPMREKLASLNDSERATVRGVAKQVATDFARNVADPSTPPPDGHAVEAMVLARLEVLQAKEKAAQWDKLVRERIAAEDDRLAAAKAAETLRLELVAQNARERVRVKWAAIAAAVSVGLVVGQQLAPRLAGGPIHTPPPAATVDPDGGARPRTGSW